MFQSRFNYIAMLLGMFFVGQLYAQSWLDQKNQAVASASIDLKLDAESQSPKVNAGAFDPNGLWITASAGKKLPKSNYLTQRYKLDMPVNLMENGYQVTVDKAVMAGKDFKRFVIMFNSNDKIACGIAINSPTTGDLVRLDTRGQFKIRKKIKFKLPATFTFTHENDEVKINCNGKDVTGGLTFRYRVDPKVGGFFSVDAQMIRVQGNAMGISLTHAKAPKVKQVQASEAKQSNQAQADAKIKAVHRVRTLTLSRELDKVVLHSDDQGDYVIQWKGHVTLRGEIDGKKKTFAKLPTEKLLDAGEKTIDLELTQLGSFCFVKFKTYLLGMLPCHMNQVTLGGDAKPVRDTQWQSVALTARHPSFPDQPYPKTAIQNVMGWLPPDSFTPSLTKATHDFPVTPPVDDVRRDVELMHQTGWNVAAVDFTFFADYRVVRQYQMMQEWINATVAAGLDDFSIIPFLEVGTYSKSAKKSGGKASTNGRVEVDANFTAHAMMYLFEQYANHNAWLKFKGRPVVMIYRVNHNPPHYWQEVRQILNGYGWNPFIIGDLGSLQTAIHGTFDFDAWRPYGQVMDGIYSFSASLLEVSMDLPPKFRQCFSTLKNPPIIGCTVRPGYLSARPYNKNWISHRGTEIVTKSWNKALGYEPAFIHATTWNDYNEATQFSNSFSLSTSQLEIGRYYLNEYFDRDPIAGKANEPYAILSYFKTSQGNEPIRFRVLSFPTTHGAKQGQWQITLTDEHGKVVAQKTSDQRNLKQVDTWLWQWDGKITKKQTRTVKVDLTFINGDQKKVYHHIPDIAMIDGNMYGDELYYLVPIHRLAGPEQSVTLLANNQAKETVAHESIVELQIKLQGAKPDNTHVSVAGNGNLVRLAANLKQQGAWAEPRYGYHSATITEGDPREASRFVDVCESDWAHGNQYYAAQAQFADGSVAWSDTVYVTPAYDASDVSAQWVFSPRFKPETTQFVDRTQRQTPLDAAPGNTKVDYVRLPGKFDVMHLNGRQRFYTDLTALPNGPLAMEVVFKPDTVNREQILCVQRGAQATLFIDADGFLVARRLPQTRKYPNPYVDVRSKQPLTAGKMYQAIVVYDGSMLKLYLNGQLESQQACFGRRSTEMFVVGGPALPRSVIVDKDTINPVLQQVIREIDGVHEKSFYKGLLVRLTLISKALTTDQVYASYQRLSSSCFWN